MTDRTHWHGCWLDPEHDECRDEMRLRIHALVLDELVEDRAPYPKDEKLAARLTARVMRLVTL